MAPFFTKLAPKVLPSEETKRLLSPASAAPASTAAPDAAHKEELTFFQPYEEDHAGFRIAVIWTMVGTAMLIGLQHGLPYIGIKSDPEAVELLFSQVPKQHYQISVASFLSALVINFTSLLYEAGATKKQLALLSCFIKGAAAYADLVTGTGQGIILMDPNGTPCVVNRYIQWALTTPTLVYVISRISSFSTKRVALAVGAQVVVIVTGLLSQLSPGIFFWLYICMSFFFYVFVMIEMGKMVGSVLTEESNSEARSGLLFIFWSTVVVWLAFPIYWCCQQLGILSVYNCELGTLVANFVAKVLFSSSVMYGNFLTIAQRRALAKEAAEHANRLKLIEDLKASMKVKEEFLSVVSHELRTPLNGVIGLSEALLRPGPWQLGEKGLHYIKTIKNSSHHLSNIINDILDAASMAKGKLVLKTERVSLNKVVDHVFDIMGHLVKKKVTLEKNLAPDLPHIIADGSRVVQVLYNLLGNSVKFTTEGRITVSVKPMPGSLPGMEMLQLSVQDTGCGIPKEKQKLVFDAFGQGDMTAARKFGGTGLGLNIVKRLVEAHGGTINVESTPGVGSTFTVRLPVKPPESQAQKQAEGSVGDWSNRKNMQQSTPRNSGGEDQRSTDGNRQESSFDLGERMGKPTGRVSHSFDMDGGSRLHHSSGVTANVTVVEEPENQVSVTSTPITNKNMSKGEVNPLASSPSYRLIRVTHEMAGQGGVGTGPEKTLSAQAKLLEAHAALSSVALNNRRVPRKLTLRSGGAEAAPGMPCSLRDGKCLTERKPTHMEEYGNTLILSVDDEPTNHLVIEEALESAGYKMHSELDGKDALAWINGSKVLPDLILLDCMMPNMTGHEFCIELRKTVPQAVVPVIMISAKNNEDNVVEGLSHGCNDFLSKPLKRSELLARISTHLRVKEDATWVTSIVNGVLQEDTEAMQILKSILPECIIARMQDGHAYIGDSYDNVAILFSDIVGFSTMASTMSAVEVFLLLTNLYTQFDRLVDKYAVYKVETIGDGYMLAAGHDEDKDKARIGTPMERLMMMAKAMLDCAAKFRTNNGAALQIRVGVHCGPVYAGVIGSKCPRFCFIGDTVNVASRMESNSFPMCIHLSEVAYKNLGSHMSQAVSMGKRAIKGKGEMVTYLAKVGDWENGMKRFQEEQRAEAQDRQDRQELHERAASLLVQQAELPPRAPPSRKLTREVSSAISESAAKRAEALAAMEAQVAETKLSLEAEKTAHQVDASRVNELETQLKATQASLMNEGALLQQAQQALAESKAQQAALSFQRSPRPAPVPMPITTLALPGPASSVTYSVRGLLRDINLEVYARNFEVQDVQLHMLVNMGHQDLIGFGISSFGHRESILQGIKEFLTAYLRAVEASRNSEL